jgi:hypothetical protein
VREIKEKLENLLRNGKKLLAGAGLISLLSIPTVVGCGTENGNGGKYTNECTPEGKAHCIEIHYNQCMDRCLENYDGKAAEDCICNCGNKTADCLEGLGCATVYVENYRCYD